MPICSACFAGCCDVSACKLVFANDNAPTDRPNDSVAISAGSINADSADENERQGPPEKSQSANLDWHTYFLFVLVGFGPSWNIPSVLFMELPDWQHTMPEKLCLSTFLNMAVHSGSIVVLLYYAIVLDLVFTTIIAFTWRITVGGHSAAILAAGVLGGVVGSISNVALMPYMARFHPRYVSAVRLGGSFVTLLAALVAGIQEPGTDSPTMSATTYLLIFSGILVAPLVLWPLVNRSSFTASASAGGGYASTATSSSSSSPKNFDHARGGSSDVSHHARCACFCACPCDYAHGVHYGGASSALPVANRRATTVRLEEEDDGAATALDADADSPMASSARCFDFYSETTSLMQNDDDDDDDDDDEGQGQGGQREEGSGAGGRPATTGVGQWIGRAWPLLLSVGWINFNCWGIQSAIFPFAAKNTATDPDDDGSVVLAILSQLGLVAVTVGAFVPGLPWRSCHFSDLGALTLAYTACSVLIYLCAAGVGRWEGPLGATALCAAVVVGRFLESFVITAVYQSVPEIFKDEELSATVSRHIGMFDRFATLLGVGVTMMVLKDECAI